MIQNYVEEYGDQEVWDQVTDEIPINIVRKLAAASEDNFNGGNSGWSFEFEPLPVAVTYGNLELCEYVISKTTDKNHASNGGVTLLHLAARDGRVDIYRLIMENVKDKNPNDPYGETALLWAAKKGNLDVCKLIIQHVEDKNPDDYRVRN